MARNNGLQVAQTTQIIFGGYGRNGNVAKYPCDGGNCQTGNCDLVEEIDGSCQTIDISKDFHDQDDAGSLTKIYSWRDSNVSPGRNSRSARGYVEVRTDWTSTVDNTNSLVVNVTSTVTRVGRDDIRNNAGGGGVLRAIAVFDINGNPLPGMPLPAVDAAYWTGSWAVNASHTQTLVIPPQKTSADVMPFRVRSWNTSRATMWSGAEKYIDEMRVGAAFKNNLPNKFDPPVLRTIEQVRNICDDNVDVQFTFEPANLAGGHIELWWRLEGQEWNESRKVTSKTAGWKEAVSVWANDLPPRRTKIYWRAKWASELDYLEDSDWTYGDFETLWFPHPSQTVPAISDAECSQIDRGNDIPEITSPDQIYGWSDISGGN